MPITNHPELDQHFNFLMFYAILWILIDVKSEGQKIKSQDLREKS